jgi:hypothetical protein
VVMSRRLPVVVMVHPNLATVMVTGHHSFPVIRDPATAALTGEAGR